MLENMPKPFTVFYIHTYEAFEDWSLSDYIIGQTRGQAKSGFVRDMQEIGYEVTWTQPMTIRKMKSFQDEYDAIKYQDELRHKKVRSS
jgi:hypothetical protein